MVQMWNGYFSVPQPKPRNRPDRLSLKMWRIFVPEGWTDDPVYPDITNQFEWSCKREKANGVWGSFSEVFLYPDGVKDGTSTEYIYALSKNYAPPAITNSQEDGHVPMEWYSAPLSVTAEYKSIMGVSTGKKMGDGVIFLIPVYTQNGRKMEKMEILV